MQKVQTESEEKSLQASAPEVNNRPSFSMALIPRDFNEAMQMAVVLSKSGIVPKEFLDKPNACFVAIGFGMELGIPPLQAANSIMVVNGRPSIWGDAAKGIVMRSPLCEFFDEDDPATALKQGFGKCIVKRKGYPPLTRTFSIDEAKKARLWIKQGPWQEYPGRMLMARARSWAMRDAFPDLLKGLSVREESQDIPGEPRMPQEMGAAPAKEAEIIDAQKIEDPTPPNPANQITLDQRQELFHLLQESKIPLAEWKEYVIETFGVQSSAEITQGRFPEVVEWIKANSKPEENS